MPNKNFWPITLKHGDVTLRPLKVSDADTWEELRRINENWLTEWEATPPMPTEEPAPTFRQVTRRMRKDARKGICLPFVVEYQKQFVGQLNVNNIVYGSLREANFGYWIDQRFANRGIMTTAAALVTDHLILNLKLHRVEIAIRPENEPSNALMNKLGFLFEGLRPSFLHINHAWRDHNIYVMTSERLTRPLTESLPPIR
jgi:ribosomal-protein-alanine N-acetyltransferase